MSDLTISSLGKDVDDLMGMSEEELRTLVTETYGETGDEDLAILLTTLSEEFAAVQDGINTDKDDAEDKLDEAEDADDLSDIARYTDELEEYQELEDGLDALQESINEEVERQVYLTRESSDDIQVFVEGTFTADDLADGETISITATGVDPEGIFAEEDVTVSNDADGDGVADSDVNGDTRIDGADLYYEADAGLTYDQTLHQEVYFSLTSTQQITATAYDASRQSRLFTVYDSATMKTFQVDIIGDVRIQFTGTNYITDAALNSAPDDVTRYSFDNANPASWYDNMHEEEIALTVDQQKSAIPGYQDIIDNLPTDLALMDTYIAQSAALSDSSTDVPLPSNAADIITTWVGYLFDSACFNSYNTETDTVEAWDKVYAELATYSPELQASLLGSLTYVIAKTSMKNNLTVATNANATLFSTLFAAQAIKLETIVGYAGDGNANDDGNDATTMGAVGELIYTIVGMDSGGTGYTANANMLTDGLSYSATDGVSGKWVGHPANSLALDWYGLFKSAVGQSPSADFAAAKAREDDITKQEEEEGTSAALEAGDLENLSGSMQMAVVDHIADVDDFGGGDDINVDQYTPEMTDIITEFTRLVGEGTHSVSDIATAMHEYIKGFAQGHWNDLATTFVLILNEACAANGLDDFATQFFNDSTFRSRMDSFINRDIADWEWDQKPNRADDANKLLGYSSGHYESQQT